jgi:hypothetical protein
MGAGLATHFAGVARGLGRMTYSTEAWRRSDLVGSRFETTAAEAAARVVPANYAYAPGDIRRYGANEIPGTTDMTAAIANALLVSASHRTVFQPETYLTGKQTIRSGCDIYLPPGCRLLDTGLLGPNDRFLNISSEVAGAPISDVRIVGWGAKVQLVKANYNAGEQRHGVFIGGEIRNVSIEGLESSDSGGDGFYVGGVGGALPFTPENIRLIGVKADNNRRNALSITAAKHMTVASCRFTNTRGTSPQRGIDVEPDSNGAGAMVGDLEDILIIGCYSEGNAGDGFSFTAGLYTAVGKRITVTFQDCVDNGSATNFQINTTRHDVDGVISFRNCKGFNARYNGFDCISSGMRCEVDGMWIYHANQGGNVRPHHGSSYAIYSINSIKGSNGSIYGNIRIRNSFAIGTTAVETVTQLISGEDQSVMRDVDIEVSADGDARKRTSLGLMKSQVAGVNRVVITADRVP